MTTSNTTVPTRGESQPLVPKCNRASNVIIVNYGNVDSFSKTTSYLHNNDNNDSDSDDDQVHLDNFPPLPHKVIDDVIDTFSLGIPIFISSASWVGKKTTDTALLGHVGKQALAASALSDLWTTCSLVLLQGRVLTILVGNAVGSGNPKLAGVYLQVSGLFMVFLSVVVIVAWNITEYIWLGLGSETDTAQMAGYYSRVLSMSIPAIVVYVQLLQFFSAQRIMYPGVYSSVLGLIANLAFGLVMVVGWPIPGFEGYGFVACPIVTMGVTYMQIIFFLFYYIWLEQLHLPCWPGWKFSEITWQRMWTFMDLYFPSAMSAASDYWRVAIIGIVAARMGETEVSEI
jgi:multidrug resistance protein, MATE family